MKRLVVTFLVALLLIFPAYPLASSEFITESIRALAIPIVQVVRTEQGRARLRGAFTNICTVGSINESKHYWLTAAHCIANVDLKYYVMGEEVKVVMRDVKNDLAILQTVQAKVPALKLAPQGLKAEDDVKMYGHPFGFAYPIFSKGFVMHPALDIGNDGASEEGDNTVFTILQMVGAPGSSGSPVLNVLNEIVGVVQIGFGVRLFDEPQFGVVMGSVPYDILVQYKGYWDEQ